jgi:hypothetical protein
MASHSNRALAATAVLAGMAGYIPGAANAQEDVGLRLYGFAQVDYIQDFNRVDPAWDDTLRPSRIPTEDGQFGDDGTAVIGVRQSRLGLEARQPLNQHDLFVKLEFDFFGVGDNEGQVTPRLRHAYGTWGRLLIGQTNTTFMDIDTFPNVVDYWGPNGMVFVRNPQLRWSFIDNESMALAVALENPSDDVDPGQIRIIDPELGANIVAREEVPDLAAHFRYRGDWGHVQVAGLLRNLAFETLGTPGNEPTDSLLGWGLNLTSVIKTGERSRFLLGFVYGEGIASYMNDGGVDLAPAGAPGDLDAEAVPLLGLSLYYDHYWNDELSTSIGYSRTEVDNTSFQAPEAYNLGEYASVNLLYTPRSASNVLLGAELLWGRREDNDGEDGEDVRIQFTGKYSFSSD